jgi:hypothetical protein
MRSFTLPSIATKLVWNAFSVSVRVGYAEFAKSASISGPSLSTAAASRAFTHTMKTCPANRGNFSSR